MSVTLSEVKRAARAHRAPLAGESAGYLILAIADQVLGAPRVVQAAEVELTPDGALRVLSGLASSDTDAELSLRRALDQLLVVASSGSAALTRAGRRTSPLGLSALVRELEAALIPVNRAAARRALSRVHRETLRALASGALPAEDQQAAPAVAAQGALPAADRADLATAIGSLASTVELEQKSEPEPPLEASDALTLALEVRTQNKPEPPLEFDVDMALEPDFVDSGEAPTVMVAHGVEPVAEATPEAARESLPPLELRSDACTRPEPVVLRRALRPTPLAEQLASFREDVPRTPALGSLAAELPQLSAEQIVQLSRDSNAAQAAAAAALPSPAESLEPAPGSAALDECTEQMPEVAPLSPAVALVASRHSDLSELLSSFQIGPGPGDSSQGLPRAIKEMADLDLTPAPFAALIR